MANHTKTVSNSLHVFGMGPPQRWDQMLWDQTWDDGTIDIIHRIGKLVSNSESITSQISSSKNVFFTVSNSVVFSDELFFRIGKTYSNAVSLQDSTSHLWTAFLTISNSESITSDVSSTSLTKVISNSALLTDSVSSIWTAFIDVTNTLNITDSYPKDSDIDIENVLELLSASQINLIDSEGYGSGPGNSVLWTEDSTTTTWTEQVTGSTTWN